MSDTRQIVCPHCATTNRVAIDRIADRPLCGRCKQSLFVGAPLTLTAGNFDRQVNNSDLPVLVDFWAPWCAPCKAMAPVIDAATKALATTVRVAKLNTEDEGEIAARFGIRSIPTLIILRRGQIIERHSGTIDLDRLIGWVQSAIVGAQPPRG